MGIRVDVLFILIIQNDRTVIAGSLYDICHITGVLLSGLALKVASGSVGF